MSEAEIIVVGEMAVRWQESAPSLLDEEQRRAVDEVWNRVISERNSALHDSPILVFRRIEARPGVSVVHGEYVPYRYYYTRRELGSGGAVVDPIGVNGMTFVAEGARRVLVLGRRSATVSWYPGCWECVPSGGLDRRCARPDGSVDFAAMLLDEFEEELCLPAARARIGASFGFVYDPATWTYDVCCSVEAVCSASDLLESVGKSGEYTELVFVPENEMTDAVERLGEELIPTARAMIRMHGEMR